MRAKLERLEEDLRKTALESAMIQARQQFQSPPMPQQIPPQIQSIESELARQRNTLEQVVAELKK
jgi:hypothetical protein